MVVLCVWRMVWREAGATGITDHVQAEHPREELIDAPELGEHVYSKHLMYRYGQIWQVKITILDVYLLHLLLRVGQEGFAGHDARIVEQQGNLGKGRVRARWKRRLRRTRKRVKEEEKNRRKIVSHLSHLSSGCEGSLSHCLTIRHIHLVPSSV